MVEGKYINIKKILLLYNTIKYLKLKQVYYRLYYIVKSKIRNFFNIKYPLSESSTSNHLVLSSSIIYKKSYRSGEFTFLNKTYVFKDKIDWNFIEYGTLWTYNLCYFDYLNQRNLEQNIGLELVNNFIDNINNIKDGMDPFPISLRGINWIKFLVEHSYNNQKINDVLYSQYKILAEKFEYHLLGNHLLENAFSLLYAAYYFQNENFYLKSKKILIAELDEQILKDGAHFELSPMYHQLMLFRVLDCINLIQNNPWKNYDLLKLFIAKAEIMLGWLNAITYTNGDIPLLNDSTSNIAPSTQELNDYASDLGVSRKDVILNESGYRKIKKDTYELIVDIGNIGPDYIPGHAHSDTFNFELYVQGKPLIVDTGLSTYESNSRRQLEKSTKSHNTVEVNNKNQSEVWGGFRVARRAKVISLKESGDDTIEATHDGYSRQGVLHTRKFSMQDDKIIISDILSAVNIHHGIAYIHFHPNVDVVLNGNILVCDDLSIMTTGIIKLGEYDYSNEFNVRLKAQYAKMSFSCEHKTEILMNRKS